MINKFCVYAAKHLPGILAMLLFSFLINYSFAQKNNSDSLQKQTKQIQKENLTDQVDISDLYNDIFQPKKKKNPTKEKSGITIIPNVAANPTIGLQGGIKAVAGKVLGKNKYPNTYMSIASTSASITTKGIVYFYINHNIFTPGNKWNFQGSLVASKSVTPDFGLGIGEGSNRSADDEILTDPERKGYSWHSQYYKFFEKAYKQVLPNLFVGGGLEFDIRRKINDASKQITDDTQTPYEIYNAKYGFANDHYASNGFLFNAEYTTRDNQNRAYKGIYADVGLRVNQTWIGSTKNASVITIDLRKYISLSKKTPEEVLALWTWSGYVLTGEVPYFELPGTGRDPNFRSGRGYVSQYFKGRQYFYSEAEYRFPLTRNQLLSGVTFVNLQTANNNVGTNLFEVWQPSAGLGLRVLFNKATRTNLCLDYAWGKYGSKGFFLGLNEAF